MSSQNIKALAAGDYVVFVLVLLISAGIGVFFAIIGRKKKSTGEFLMAGRQMTELPISLSLLASFMSAITLLGTPSEMFYYGTIYWWIALSYVFVILMSNYIYLPVFYNLQITSSYEYLGFRFHKMCQIMSAIVFMFQMTIYMGMVLYTPSLALSAVTGLNVWISVFSVGIVCTFYTTLGGMKAVMWTDVFQMVMMFAGLFAVIVQGAIINGGPGNIWQIVLDSGRVEYFNFAIAPHHRHTIWSLIIGGTFTWLAIYGVNQTMVQRGLTAKSLKTAQRAFWINFPGLSALLSVCCLCGLICIATYVHCDPITAGRISAPDQLLPLFVMDHLGDYPGLPGLFTACLFSGALSTVSSGLNSLAAVTLHDLVMQVYPALKDSTAQKLTKILAIVFGVVSLLFAYISSKLGQLLQAALGLFGMLGGPVLGVFSLGMLFPMSNWKGAVVGHTVSQIITLWIGFGYYVYGVVPPKLPVYIDQCPENDNITRLISQSIADQDAIPYPFKTSYIWYSSIGCSVVVFIGLIVSALTGFNGSQKTPSAYISPVIRPLWRLLPPDSRFAMDESDLNRLNNHRGENTELENVEVEVDDPKKVAKNALLREYPPS